MRWRPECCPSGAKVPASSIEQFSTLLHLPQFASIPPCRPPKLEDIINKALEKDRNLRYQSAAEMRADLQRLKRDTDSGRSGTTATARGESYSGAGTDSFPGAPAAPKPGRLGWKVWAVGLGLALIAVRVYLLSRPLPTPSVSG
jgi:serine/threonine protein kinase